jgi:polysaccharide biosynthesis transport protein
VTPRLSAKTFPVASALVPSSSSTLFPATIETPSFYRILRRHRTAALAGFVVCLVLGIAASLLQTRIFRSEALVEVQHTNSQFMKTSDYAPTSAEGGTADAFLSTQVRLLKSTGLALAVVEDTNLDKSQIYFMKSRGSALFDRMLKKAEAPKQPSVEETARLLLSRLTVSQVGDSNLISIKVDAPDSQLAAELANAVVAEFIKYQQKQAVNTSLQTSSLLTDQLEDFRTRLQDSERRLQDYAKTAGLLFTDERTMATDEQLRLIQADLVRAQSDRADKEAELELLKSAPPESLPKVLDDAPLRDIAGRLTDLRRQLAELSTTLTPKSYKVQTVEAEIAALEGELRKQRDNVLHRIRNEYQASVEREHLLGASYERQVKVVTNDSGKAVRYNVLKQEVEANRSLYSAMLQKVKEASVLSGFQSSPIRLADSARPAVLPYQPNMVKNAGFGSLAGLLCAMLVVLVRERMDSTVRRRGQTPELLQVPELGVIPSAPGVAGRTLRALGSPGHSTAANILVDAFNCTAISIDGRRDTKVILFTSTQPREGKSTIVANLARALARTGRNGVVVDGDLRRSTLHKIFSAESGPGLVEILRGQAPLSGTLSVLKADSNSGMIGSVDLIPAGDVQEQDWSLLRSVRMGELMADLRKRYDFVLIDSPPMLHMADARILARHTDGVVLVCRAGQSRSEHVVEAAQILEQDGSALLGTVLNDWDIKAEDPGYFSAYKHY